MWSKTIIERTYFDRCNIYRKTDTTDQSGITKQTRQPVAEFIPCALSKKRLEAYQQQDGHGAITNEHILFISPEIEVMAGDEIEVIRSSLSYATPDLTPQRYWAGEPFLYSSHQEVPLRKEERA